MERIRIISISIAAVLTILIFVVCIIDSTKSSNTDSTANSTTNSNTDSTAAIDATETTIDTVSPSQISKYNDGMYTGEGSGKNPGTKICVTIANDKISDITVVNTYDNAEYFDEAALALFPEIMTTQSTVVDTVSGATLSSKGILQAVNDALSQAAVQ